MRDESPAMAPSRTNQAAKSRIGSKEGLRLARPAAGSVSLSRPQRSEICAAKQGLAVLPDSAGQAGKGRRSFPAGLLACGRSSLLGVAEGRDTRRKLDPHDK